VRFGQLAVVVLQVVVMVMVPVARAVRVAALQEMVGQETLEWVVVVMQEAIIHQRVLVVEMDHFLEHLMVVVPVVAVVLVRQVEAHTVRLPTSVVTEA
jgi:hypothetical protein